MLITTYAGLVVNSDFVAYIAVKRCETAASDDLSSGSSRTGTLHKVLLYLAGGEHVVVAPELGLTTAQRLRQEIARRWAENACAFDAADALQRLCDSPTKGEH